VQANRALFVAQGVADMGTLRLQRDTLFLEPHGDFVERLLPLGGSDHECFGFFDWQI
jgi:hypothetical protein